MKKYRHVSYILKLCLKKVIETKKYRNKTKAFHCDCIDGFDGDFCEHKVENNQLLFLSSYDDQRWRYLTTEHELPIRHDIIKLILNDEGRLLRNDFEMDNISEAHHSCSVMMNGQALIFSGYSQKTQVK